MKKILCLLLALWSVPAAGCHCFPPILSENYQDSEFVALVKILKATPDPKSSTYLILEIDLLNLYKGEATSTMRINTMANTSLLCVHDAGRLDLARFCQIRTK